MFLKKIGFYEKTLEMLIQKVYTFKSVLTIKSYFSKIS